MEPVNIYTSNNVRINKDLGGNQLSTVYSATLYSVPEKKIAIKTIDLTQLSNIKIQKCIDVQKNMKHENIVPILNYEVYTEEDEELWIFMPMYRFSVSEMLRLHYSNGIVDFFRISSILRDILTALVYIHGKGVIHRDIKGSNILLDNKDRAYIADIGISAVLKHDIDTRKTIRKTFVESLEWMSPEVIQGQPYDTKTDIWSFGIIALELVLGKAPRSDYPPLKIILCTISEGPPAIPLYIGDTKIPKSFRSLVSKCLRKDQRKRPGATKLLNHRFFTQYIH